MLDALALPTLSADHDHPSRSFEALVAANLPGLRMRAARMCRGVGDPDDLVQDALIRAFRARDQVRSPERARGWLLAIVTNTFLDGVRRRRVRPREVAMVVEPPAPTRDDEPEDEPWGRLTVDDVRAAVDRLPDDVRETYRMFALDGLDYIAIAAALGIPKATVGTRIRRARHRLRALLQESVAS